MATLLCKRFTSEHKQHVFVRGIVFSVETSASLCKRPKRGAGLTEGDLGVGQTQLGRADAVRIIVIAGDLDGHTGPGSTYTPITLVHATVSPGARLNLPWRRDFNALVYVLAGQGTVGSDRRPVRKGQLVVLGAGARAALGGGQALAVPQLRLRGHRRRRMSLPRQRGRQ